MRVGPQQSASYIFGRGAGNANNKHRPIDCIESQDQLDGIIDRLTPRQVCNGGRSSTRDTLLQRAVEFPDDLERAGWSARTSDGVAGVKPLCDVGRSMGSG